MRVVLLLLMLADLTFIVTLWGAYQLLVKMTYITEIMSSLWLFLSIVLHHKGSPKDSDKGKQSLGLLALHHIAFELSVLTNTITMVIYWSLLHKETINSVDVSGHPIRFFHVYFCHIAPGMFVLTNFLISDVVMESSHVGCYVSPFILYCYNNYLESMKRGKAIYSFMNFVDDFQGAIRNLAIVYTVSILYYVGVSKLTRLAKADFVKESQKVAGSATNKT